MKHLKRTFIAALISSVLLTGPAMSYDKPSEDDFVQTYKIKNGVAQVNWTDNIITAEGWGSPPNNPNMSASQKKNQAYTAALVIARRNLLAILQGVHINSKTTVKDAVAEEDVIEEKLDGFIKGAQIVSGPVYEADGTVKVTLGVKIFGKKDSVADVVAPVIKEEIKVEPTPVATTKPEPTPKPEEIDNQEYTSLIIDCTGLHSEPAMSPAVFNISGSQIYISNTMEVSPDTVINEGIVKYYKTMDGSKDSDWAGKKPLIVKAMQVQGIFKSDIVVSNKDAQKIQSADKKGNFLRNLRVIMIL